jgi:hypothetical protein
VAPESSTEKAEKAEEENESAIFHDEIEISAEIHEKPDAEVIAEDKLTEPEAKQPLEAAAIQPEKEIPEAETDLPVKEAPKQDGK